MIAQASLERVGAECINSQHVPVFALPDVRGRFVEVQDAQGRAALVSVEAAKAFKKGQYPLHPALDAAVQTAVHGDSQPFALRSPDVRTGAAQHILRELMARIQSSGVEFSFMASGFPEN
jgi:hypothetical protein